MDEGQRHERADEAGPTAGGTTGGEESRTRRRASTGRRDAWLTLGIVCVLLLAVGAILRLDLTPSTGVDEARTASEGAASGTTPSASATAGPDGAARRGGDRLPARKPGTRSPSAQDSPPPLPTLTTLDRRQSRQGFERVPTDQVAAASFTVASFNVLGASHTRGNDRRKGYAGAEQRLGGQLDALAAGGVTLVGTQEFQQDQVRALARRGGDWAIFPGLELGPRLADNSIMWRPSVWERVRTQTTPVPYFGGNMVPMPQVLLRHRETGRQVWIGNFHNPADSRGNAAGFRQRAIEIEADLATRLGADGTPVLITGDFNDRERFACPFSQRSGMTSANGARTENGRCITPQGMFVDWIFGSSDLTFSGYVADRSVERRKLSDHPLIRSEVTLPGVEEREGCRQRISRQGLAWYCRA